MDIQNASALRSLKRDLRRRMETKRAEAKAQNPDAGFSLRDHFLKAITLPPQSVIASYHPHNNEINPTALTEALRAQGHMIALPVLTTKDAPLAFRIFKSGDTLVKSAMGIPEPPPSAPLVEPDILLVPLLAFDRHGYRLGYGGGYYDRTLAFLRSRKKVLAIGIAFACQEVAEVPFAPHDAKLDKMASEMGVF